MKLRLLISVLCSLLLVPRLHALPPLETRRHTEAIALGKKALEYFLRKEFRTAAEMYRRAAQVEPGELTYMVGVGRSEAQAGRVAEATAAFEEVLARAPDGHPLRQKAENGLIALRNRPAETQLPVAQPAAVPTDPTPVTALPSVVTPATVPLQAAAPAPENATRPVAPVPAAAGHTRLAIGWSLAALGVVAAGSAAWLGVSAQTDQNRLDALHLPDGRYDLSRISYETAVSRQRGINDDWTGMGVLIGSAVVMEIVGLWLATTTPAGP